MESKMRYSEGFKQSILKRVLPPCNEGIRQVSRETGVNKQTICNWLNEYRSGKFPAERRDLSPRDYSLKEKYHVLLESSKYSDEDIGRYLRERGVHTEHLTMWDQEIRDMLDKKNGNKDSEVNLLKKRIKALEKELNRKDKALAETTALLVLKKKLDALIMEDEDD